MLKRHVKTIVWLIFANRWIWGWICSCECRYEVAYIDC